MPHLLSCGSNAHGQLGNGSLEDSYTFKECVFAENLPADSKILDLALGANHTVALLGRKDSTGGFHTELWGCGDGRQGQLGQRYHMDVEHGTPGAIFRRLELSLAKSGLEDFRYKSIVASWETTYVVLECPGHSDVIISLGSDGYGDLGVGGLPKKLSRKKDFYLVLLKEHTSGEPFIVENIATGQRHIVVVLRLLRTQSLLCVGWGTSRHGQLGPLLTNDKKDVLFFSQPKAIELSTITDPIISLSLGIQHTVFLHSSGHLSKMGSNRKGQLDLPDDLHADAGWSIRSAGSNSHSQLGRHPSSASVVFPESTNTTASVKALACGSEHCLVLFNTLPGRSCDVWGWGWNEHGNLGIGDTNDVPEPTKIWPTTEENGDVHGIWAGCGTSWICQGEKGYAEQR